MGNLDITARLTKAKQRKWDDRTLAQQAAELAQEMLLESRKEMRSDERTLLSALHRMVTDEKNRDFVRNLCSRVFQLSNPVEQAENLRHCITEYGGVPNIFSTMGKLRFKAASMAAGSMQSAAIAEVQRVFHATFGGLTLPTQLDKVDKYVKECAKSNTTPALLPLVPDVFGNKSAGRYLHNLEAVLQKQKGVGIVVQPQRLCPSLSPYAPNQGANELADILRNLLQLSLKNGEKRPVIIQYGNSLLLNVVVEAFKLAMSAPECRKAEACLELPAYLKNSPAVLRDLTDWASNRAAKGGTPIKILLVKGSHLTPEQELSFRHGNANPVSTSKAETETRFKNLVHTAISAGEKIITPIIGTHNIFDMAYALLDWGRCGRSGLPEFCFIAGLADHLGRMLGKEGAKVIQTMGVTTETDAVGFDTYLLDLVQELARPDGFLAAGPTPETNSMGWGKLRQQFLASLSGREETTNRHGSHQTAVTTFTATPLDKLTDRARFDQLMHAAVQEHERRQETIPLVINNERLETPLTCIRRSLSALGMEDYRFDALDFNAVEKLLDTATFAAIQIQPQQEDLRLNLLKVARELEKQETEIIALLMRDAGFTIEEADIELRNAIDACRFYEWAAISPGLQDGTQVTPLGVVVVATDRVHPLAHAMSGIAAAWVSGNVVIYKPSCHTMLVARKLVDIMQQAGMEAPRLLLAPCPDNQIGDRLMNDKRVNGLIFYGSSTHISNFRKTSPLRPVLSCGTGHTIAYLASSADWHQAIADLTHTAFSRAGQSHQAPHIVLVHAEIYDNQAFIHALKDTVNSIKAAPVHREGAHIGPLATRTSSLQKQLLTRIEKNETWLVQPHIEEMGSQIWSPGVRTGVLPNSDFVRDAHNIPVIGLIRVNDTATATALQRDLCGGLSAIIYSQDEAEITTWSQQVNAGNVAINCCPLPQPGVLPLGNNSAGCPKPDFHNFLSALGTWQEIARPQHRSPQRNIPFAPWEALSPKPTPDETTRLGAAADSIAYWWGKEFGIEHTLCASPALTTTLIYRPVNICLRAENTMSDIDLSIMLMAALKAGCRVLLSTANLRPWMPRALEHLGVTIQVESREEYENRFAAMASEGFRVRDTAADDNTKLAAAHARLHLSDDSVLANARLEMLHYLTEHISTRRNICKQ